MIKHSPVSQKRDDTNRLKYLLINKIDQLGNFKFSDDSWYYSRKHKDSLPKGCYTIPFHKVPEKYKEWVKYYALHNTSSASNILKRCYKIAEFLQFLDKHYPATGIAQITRQQVNAFEYQLHHSGSKINTKQFTYASLQDFFMRLSDFPEMPNVLPTKNINPFRQESNPSDKRLPTKVIRAWDSALKDDNLNIPLEFRLVYWLIRSFPNRITEILSMKRNCIKSFYSEYVIQIPTFKQSGGYDREEVKAIPVIYAGHGKYVIDLIRKLQLQTEELIHSDINSKIDPLNLFVTKYWYFHGSKRDIVMRYRSHKLRKWTGPNINLLLEQLAFILDIRDEKGILVIPTTHQFRHNAVTDRLYMVGYTVEQVRRLTGHKNAAMTQHYTHQLIEKHKEIHMKLSELPSAAESAYEFKGKVVNLDKRTVSQLEKDPRKYLTWEAKGKKGVGICSDISGCNPKGTSIHFECYACQWFVPKAEYYEDYKMEYSYWNQVIERTSGDPRRTAHLENAIRNASYLERILEICEKGLEQYKHDAVPKLMEEHKTVPIWE